MNIRAFVIVGSLFLTGFVRGAETYVIAKITDMLGNVGYEVMTKEEYAATSKMIMEENKVFTKVIMDCKKEWKTDENRKGAFQSSKVKPRKIMASGAPYKEKEKAQEKIAKLEESATEKRLEELEDHKKKWKNIKEDDRAKEEEKLNSWRESFELVSKKMQEALGREIPNYGFELIAPDPNKKH